MALFPLLPFIFSPFRTPLAFSLSWKLNVSFCVPEYQRRDTILSLCRYSVTLPPQAPTTFLWDSSRFHTLQNQMSFDRAVKFFHSPSPEFPPREWKHKYWKFPPAFIRIEIEPSSGRLSLSFPNPFLMNLESPPLPCWPRPPPRQARFEHSSPRIPY